MPEGVELQRKTGPRGLLRASYKRLEKKTLIGPGVLQRRQSVSLHAWRHQGPRKPSSCAPFMLSSHWGRAATGKDASRLDFCSSVEFSFFSFFLHFFFFSIFYNFNFQFLNKPIIFFYIYSFVCLSYCSLTLAVKF